MSYLALVSCPGQQDQGDRILELAEFMGIPTRKITVDGDTSTSQILSELGGRKCSVVMSAEALASLRELFPPEELTDLLENECAKLLVFSTGCSGRQDVFRWLTNGAIRGLAPSRQASFFELPENSRRISGVFAGQRFAVNRPVVACALDLRDQDSRGIDEIMLADGQPLILRMERGACELFVLALAEIPDINQRLSQKLGIEDHYDQLIPLLILLRHCFADICWHGAGGTARFIIDDPLVVPTYGFLSYDALRISMRTAGYGTSIAFIPWNYWRTSRTNAAAIFGEDANLSICVHGCDHTNREFQETDTAALQWKADTALRRMELHKARSGLAFDPVMVFPQGKFSSSAVLALRKGGYLAAVNTTCFPTDDGAHALTIGDFLRPAITRFHGFPIFPRRYPRRLVDSAFDIFLGRPVLLVQHHDDFRSGYEQQQAFVAGLHKLEPKLTWAALSDQLVQSCLIRSLSRRAMEIRFFTSQFTYRNAHPDRTALTFSKEEPDPSAVSNVLVNGTPVAFSFKDGFLIFEHQLDTGQSIHVSIVDKSNPSIGTDYRPAVTHTFGVPVRRALSEFRDNTLARYPRLLAAATGLATRMKATGTDGRAERT